MTRTSIALAAFWFGIGCTRSHHMAAVDAAANSPPSDAAVTVDASGWRTAQLTMYWSYPTCCPDSPVYDPNAPTDECVKYSGCKYQGDFAVIGHQSLAYVQSHDLVAFYDDSDPDGNHFETNYGGKTIQLSKNGMIFEALIADTCGNADCNGCCAQNSKGGFLVDMEYWTALRRLGAPVDGVDTIQFNILQ
jgi:hypothetical protein